jgi:hypothetical protein
MPPAIRSPLGELCIQLTIINRCVNKLLAYPDGYCRDLVDAGGRRGTMYFRGLNIDLKRLIREGWIHNDSLSKQAITKS